MKPIIALSLGVGAWLGGSIVALPLIPAQLVFAVAVPVLIMSVKKESK